MRIGAAGCCTIETSDARRQARGMRGAEGDLKRSRLRRGVYRPSADVKGASDAALGAGNQLHRTRSFATALMLPARGPLPQAGSGDRIWTPESSRAGTFRIDRVRAARHTDKKDVGPGAARALLRDLWGGPRPACASGG